MIINVARRELLALAKKVARAAPSALASSEELKGLLLEADDRAGTIRLTATNHEIAIQAVMPATIEQGGSVVLPTSLFLEMLPLLSDDHMYMEAKNESLLYIRSGSTHYQISVFPGERYPKVDIPLPGDTVQVSGLKSLVRKTAFAVDKETSKNPALSCIHLIFSEHGLRAAAGSSYSAVQAEGDRESTGNLSILIPTSSLKLLAALSHDSDVYEVGITGTGPEANHAVFFDGTLTFSARLIQGEHLKLEHLFSQYVPTTSITMESAELKRVLGDISVFVGSSDTIELKLRKNAITLKCETEQGGTSGTIPVAISDPPSKAFHLHARRLMDCVSTVDGSITMSLNAVGTLVLQTETMKYMQPGSTDRKSVV